jgi:hypothetical protein
VFFISADNNEKMSDSLAEQLANVKLRPSKNKTKDFSDPKLVGKLKLNAPLAY